VNPDDGTDRSQDHNGTWKDAAEGAGAIFIVGPILLVLLLAPYFVLIFAPWKILHDSAGLSHLWAGLIAFPLGFAAATFLYWLVATGRATLGDD